MLITKIAKHFGIVLDDQEDSIEIGFKNAYNYKKLKSLMSKSKADVSEESSETEEDEITELKARKKKLEIKEIDEPAKKKQKTESKGKGEQIAEKASPVQSRKSVRISKKQDTSENSVTLTESKEIQMKEAEEEVISADKEKEKEDLEEEKEEVSEEGEVQKKREDEVEKNKIEKENEGKQDEEKGMSSEEEEENNAPDEAEKKVEEKETAGTAKILPPQTIVEKSPFDKAVLPEEPLRKSTDIPSQSQDKGKETLKEQKIKRKYVDLDMIEEVVPLAEGLSVISNQLVVTDQRLGDLTSFIAAGFQQLDKRFAAGLQQLDERLAAGFQQLNKKLDDQKEISLSMVKALQEVEHALEAKRIIDSDHQDSILELTTKVFSAVAKQAVLLPERKEQIYEGLNKISTKFQKRREECRVLTATPSLLPPLLFEPTPILPSTSNLTKPTPPDSSQPSSSEPPKADS